MNEKRKYKIGLLETLGIKDVLSIDWNLFFLFCYIIIRRRRSEYC